MTGKQALLQGRPLHALSATHEITHSPSTTPQYYTNYLGFLSSCKDLNSLLQIHCRLIVSGLKNDNPTSTHLINSYSSFKKCHLARLVFDYTQNPSVVLCNTMIRAYTRANQHKDAINMYHFMLNKGLEPDKYSFTFVLKACTCVLDLQEGILVHGEIINRKLECDVYIGTGLVDMYSKMGDLRSAREAFDKMPTRDVVAWNAMIAGLAQSLDPCEAMGFFKRMQLCGVEPNSVSLLNVMPAVSKLMDIDASRIIHGHVIRKGFSPVLYNGLIDVYCKCGNVYAARCIFDRMCGRDDVSWGTMMAGYAHNGSFIEVLELVDSMKTKNLKMSKVSVVSALLAVAEMRDLEQGKEIHDFAIQQGFDSNIVVATIIMTMYAKCGLVQKAKQLFWGLQERDLVAWSAIIATFVQSGYPEETLSFFRDLLKDDLRPNNVILVSVLPACAELSSLRLGKSIHCYAIKNYIDSDISTGTALVSMYARCGFFFSALIIFNRIPCKDVVTWNALINAYAQYGYPYHAVEMFHKLQASEANADSKTVVGLLPACALLNDLDLGSCIHGQTVKCGFESDCYVYNALIDMYAKCGSLSSAEFLFTRTEFNKDKISWNVIISGYMQNGHAREAISAYNQMKLEHFRPNIVTIVSILPAMAYLSALREGMAIHACIIKMGYQSNTLVGNSLIDMYAKCGRLDYSENSFNEVCNKDTVSWNAMITGYAVHGQGDHAIALLSLMQEKHVRVDSTSFISVLSGCRHAGLIEEGRKMFYSIREKYNLEPDLGHYACMVDLLGRAGLFDETLALIKAMPMKPDAGVWGALLNACRMHSNVQLAKVALNHLVELEPKSSTHYIVLSSIYAQSGRWADAGKTRLKINETGLKKTPGCSWG
ncbi:PPR domain-containing protein/PPR_2 domain-containing protein [Cephalotus follicularis]|uniref:PPR domain-containing protein/PPR_2 domain-containing protein n=1 Tax=Cephalotus follicularis TaxID=3775 RepID=A0A1Q3C713_CEPFO|nr:PPR domain-containing protein/PPR_2 domain-containing protein [Cephalotus follicularis]